MRKQHCKIKIPLNFYFSIPVSVKRFRGLIDTYHKLSPYTEYPQRRALIDTYHKLSLCTVYPHCWDLYSYQTRCHHDLCSKCKGTKVRVGGQPLISDSNCLFKTTRKTQENTPFSDITIPKANRSCSSSNGDISIDGSPLWCVFWLSFTHCSTPLDDASSSANVMLISLALTMMVC